MKKIFFIILGIFAVIAIILLIIFDYNLQRSYKQSNQNVGPNPTTQQKSEQGQLDLNFSKTTTKVYDDYPWLNKLPLVADDYFVFFSPKDKKFIATLYLPPTTLSDSPVIDERKQEVLRQVSNLGIDTSKYSFQWNIQTHQ